MIGLLIILVVIGVVCLIIWVERKYKVLADDHASPPSPPSTLVQPEPKPKRMDVTLSLPSSDVYFQFTCEFVVTYTPTHSNVEGLAPPHSSVESLLYSAAKERSSKLALPQHEQLRHELDSAFRTPQPMPQLNFRIYAYCKKVNVDLKQLDAIQRNYEDDLKAERLRRQVAYLGTVFEDPRVATMWWLARHDEQIDELPGKAELLYRLDRRLHPDTNPSELPVSRDLDWFLEGADDAERSAIGVALAGIYRKFDRDDLAEEAERLIPNRTLPPHNGSRPGTAGNRVPSQPLGQ